MAAAIDWAETKAILMEVEQLFNRDDDIRDVQDIKKMQNEIELYCANSMKDTKELIKEMTNRVAAKEAEVLAPTEAEHAKEVQNLVSQNDALSYQIDGNREMLNKRRAIILEIVSKTANLKQQINDTMEQKKLSDMRTSYAISLYGKISNITWDYDQEGEDALAGYICLDKSKEIRPFKIDGTLSSLDKTNQLWALIGQGL